MILQNDATADSEEKMILQNDSKADSEEKMILKMIIQLILKRKWFY